MSNKIIQLGRCTLIILLLGLTTLVTAQVKTVVAKNTKPSINNQSTGFQPPKGIESTCQFVIEDDIMQ